MSGFMKAMSKNCDLLGRLFLVRGYLNDIKITRNIGLFFLLVYRRFIALLSLFVFPFCMAWRLLLGVGKLKYSDCSFVPHSCYVDQFTFRMFYTLPKVRTNYEISNIKFKGPKVWNAISENLKNFSISN